MKTTISRTARRAACALAATVVSALALAQATRIDLGDIAAGGDGTGTADPAVVGIHPDTGLLESFHVNGPIGINDGTALQPVEDAVSELIDSVFIIGSADMPINTAGATFTFPPEDLLNPPQTWDIIIKDRIGGEDYPPIVGGKQFETAVGIHSAAGITFDLEALRARHGDEAVGALTDLFGCHRMGASSFLPSFLS